MEEAIKQLGFKDLIEFHSMTSNVDISTDEKLKSFNEWKNNDGTKEGLLKLK